ncbi:TIM-barrel domain-containing protein [Bacteroides sp.]|uniref:glycoside hydrolase family 31 protein n=1 Tax=Bacteroides sp. TaxID=29523 RepID=UPI002628E3F3|nr:TIM-barrel domain-containing protein [Bacteroides sp.]
MKRVILIFAFLMEVVFATQAQTHSFFKSNWQGDVALVKREKVGLKATHVASPEVCWHINALSRELSIFREVQLPDPAKTVWCSFMALMPQGSSRLGVAFEDKLEEKLFVEVKATTEPTFIVVRIDFSDAQDKAYIFHNPSVASVPDLENAEYSLTGDFDFDRIKLLAGKGAKGIVGDISLGNEFREVARPATMETKTGEGSAQTVLSWKKQGEALWVQTSGGILYLQPHRTGSLHVMYGSEREIRENKSYAVTRQPEAAAFEVEDRNGDLFLNTSHYSVNVNKKEGYISLFDSSGKLLVRELPGKARMNMTNDSVLAYGKFELKEDALYGLGQFRDNLLNLRNAKRELIQFNTQAAVPVIYSTNGWGLFWDNPSRTIYMDSSSGMSLASDYGKLVNYYLFVGDTMDKLIGVYRSLTGNAPMMPDWALGYHQSRNKYSTQKEILDIAGKMNARNLSMSTIFVDYYYWEKYGTGSHRFDENLFPDVKAMLDSLHSAYDTKLVITMWPTFNPKTEHYKELERNGFLLDGARALDGTIYDPFNPEARKMYWKQVLPLVQQGIDGWFLDGDEPDITATFLPRTTYAGPAGKVRNLYPLVHCTGFYEGLLQSRPNQRPYILTRCAWASQQRIGTAIWSGDIPTTFEELKCQIPAGLNFTATGIPYWTTDIGGYSGGNPADKDYQELFARWFEYGTFCPVFRAHGRRHPGDRKTPNEPWAYGPEVEAICRDFIDLRYKLYPYIYSLTGKVTLEHYTPMRLLAFDFPYDKKVLNLKDEFMYGPAFLVCPVLEAGAIERSVYLPEGCGWIDFWTNKYYHGGETITASAPLNRIPIYVRSGSIVPMYQTPQKHVKSDIPVDIHIYKGTSGTFDLYEDDGVTLNYEKGEYNLIRFTWDDVNDVLTISEPHKGISQTQVRHFHIHCLGEKGDSVSRKIAYKGGKKNIKLKN